ncbi:heterokaryon incompatibility protein-domain-containing protein, partial [Alternaria rosae]|uniref:heterokaryon incompatibility protein-domain-containing protein n=1 Tax=Alternaria rosae TaxID=1187941 RepID=UPI001E8E3C14
MRLINCSTLQLEEFLGTDIPRYAILSHTWGDGEVSFADFTSGQPTVRSGYQKIIFTCQQAIKDKIGYAWVDTCCIDKSSSAELSEAINSMFAWYQKAVYCYAYLPDVLAANMDQDFPKSRWFTRGWTLQEMLAPTTVFFYDQQWVELGYRDEHAEQISKITGIDEGALCIKRAYGDNKFGSYCVATRMSWASTRQTTRAEDMAYCLLGIFNINMPLLYGEGDRAFRRLQEEIVRKIDDDSILAWSLSPRIDYPGPPGLLRRDTRDDLCRTTNVDFLARSPKDFKDCADLTRATEPSTLFTLTNTGLQIQLPIVRV